MNKEQQLLLAASLKANYNQVLNQLQNQPELFQDTYFINQLMNQISEYQERANPTWSYPDFVDTVTRPFYIDFQTPSAQLNQ